MEEDREAEGDVNSFAFVVHLYYIVVPSTLAWQGYVPNIFHKLFEAFPHTQMDIYTQFEFIN